MHSLKQREVLLYHDVLHQLHQHLCVRVALELYALVYQFRLDVSIVLDDTIMDDGQVVRLRIVGMSIPGRRFTMSGPAGVCNAYTTADILVIAILYKIVNLSLGLIDIQLVVAID